MQFYMGFNYTIINSPKCVTAFILAPKSFNQGFQDNIPKKHASMLEL